MKIGVTRGNKNTNNLVAEFMKQKYGYSVVDVDSILIDIINKIENIDCKKLQKDDSLLLSVKENLNRIIADIINNNGDNVVIIFSLLEDLDIFDSCDIKIKFTESQMENGDFLDLYKNYRMSSLDSKYNESIYHLTLNDKDWQITIQDYMDNIVNNDIKVTIIVPIYNTENYISRLVNSITNQTYRNLEIILIDDGSTDNSLKMCELLASKDSRIKVVNQKNVGLAQTRNNGMKLATGKYITFFDSDDYIEPTMISSLLQKARETDADVCQGGFWIHMKNGLIKDVTNEQNGADYFEGKKNILNAHSDHLISIAAWDKLYKLSAIKDILFDDKVTKEDADYIYKLCMESKTFAVINKPFYHYIKRQSNSITSDKISPKMFLLQQWGHKAYEEVVENGREYQDAADKILFNSLVHILRNYMRDYKNGIVKKEEYRNEIQSVVNDIINLLLHAENVKKFRKLDEVLEIINELVDSNVLNKENFPSIDIPCVGILWNSLNEEMMTEAINYINKKASINECVSVDLGDLYRNFINEIYRDADNFFGVPAIKAGTLIDKYDSNDIIVLNMIIKVSNYIYYNEEKGYMFEEISELKSYIRNMFRKRIKDYAYDNVFHLTTNDDDYKNTNEVCKKYIKVYKGEYDAGK